MTMTVPRFVVFLVVMSVLSEATADAARGTGFTDCLESDSLQCVQDRIVRNLRAVFGQGESAVRKVRTAEVPMSSKDPGQRQELVNEKGSDPISNSTSESPSEDKHEDAGGVVEGRGRKLKKLLPFLLMLKIQYFVYGVVAYIVITLVAKAALLKGSLALALAGVFLLKRLLTAHHVVARTEVKYHESSHTKTYAPGGYGVGAGGYGGAVSYGAGAAGYGGGGYGGGAGHSGSGWDSYSAPVDQNKQYAHNAGHSVVYRGQKPTGR